MQEGKVKSGANMDGNAPGWELSDRTGRRDGPVFPELAGGEKLIRLPADLVAKISFQRAPAS